MLLCKQINWQGSDGPVLMGSSVTTFKLNNLQRSDSPVLTLQDGGTAIKISLETSTFMSNSSCTVLSHVSVQLRNSGPAGNMAKSIRAAGRKLLCVFPYISITSSNYSRYLALLRFVVTRWKPRSLHSEIAVDSLHAAIQFCHRHLSHHNCATVETRIWKHFFFISTFSIHVTVTNAFVSLLLHCMEINIPRAQEMQHYQNHQKYLSVSNDSNNVSFSLLVNTETSLKGAQITIRC